MAGVTSANHLRGDVLSAYLDGELLVGELDVVVTHLSSCEPCIAEFHALKETRVVLRTMPVLEVPQRILELVHYGPELSAYLDGELTADEAGEVTSHLAVCSYCRDELVSLDGARAAIRALPRLEPPVLLSVEQHRRRRLPRWRIVGIAAGIAAAAVITVGVSTSGSDPVAEIDLGSFADRHIARASVEPGFAVIPALASADGAP